VATARSLCTRRGRARGVAGSTDDVVRKATSEEEQGARVFLELEAALLLDDKVLDASVEHIQVAFTIADVEE
jgi:hypothetical protein